MSTRNIMNQNKKIFSFGVGLTILALAFIFGVQNANAADGFTAVGDFPNDGRNYRVEAYSVAQANPCDGVLDDGGIMYFSTVYGVGDATFDSNDDYSASYGTAIANPTTVYFYMCSPGQGPSTADLIVNFNKAINNDDDIELDLGRALGGVNVHNGLVSDYIHVCDAQNAGTELSTEDYQTNGGTAEYQAYYYMWEPSVAVNSGNLDNLYIYFDENTGAPCTFDSTKSAGVYVDPDVAVPYDYGVYVTFEPETKATDSIHDDIDNAGYIHAFSGTTSIGMTGAGVNTDTYNLYYDNPASGTITIKAYTGVNTTIRETISGVALGFTTQKINRRIIGDVPSDMDEVREVIGSITYSTTSLTADGAHENYALYIPSDAGAQDLLFIKSAATVFTKNINANAADTAVNVAKISGEAAAGIEDAGSADNIEVFTGVDCTTEVSSTNVQPADGAGDDYGVYFEDTDAVVYMKVSKDTATYTTCGNSVAAATFDGDQAAAVNLTIQVTGTVHADIDRVAVDDDAANSDATSGATCTAFSNVAVGTGVYYLYTSTSADLQAEVDATSNVFFPTVALPATELLERNKDLTSSLTLNVGRTTGNLHADLQNVGANDVVRVYTTAICGTELSSEDRISGAGATYTQYYEQNGATTYLGITEADGANDYVTCGVEVAFGVNGDSQTVHVDKRVLGSVPDAIDTVGIDYDQDDVDEYTQTVVAATNPDTYKIYMPGDGSSDISFYIAGPTKALERINQNFTGDSATVNVAEFSGDIHDSFSAAGGGTIQVWDDYTNPLGQFSTTSFITEAGTDTYAVYFQDVGILNVIDIKFTDEAGYVSWVNDYTDTADGAIDPGDNMDLDLSYRVTGTVPVNTDRVTVYDPTPIVGEPNPWAVGIPAAVTGAYRIYVSGAVGNYWDADTEDTNTDDITYKIEEPAGTTVFTYTTDYETFTEDKTFNAVKITGTVPTTGDTLGAGANDYVIVRDNVADVCNAAVVTTAGESQATIGDDGSTGTYAIYFLASTNLYPTFCPHGAGAVAPDYVTLSAKNLAVGTDYTLNLAAIKGEMDSEFADGAAGDIKIYDSFQTTQVGGTDNTAEDGAAITSLENGGNDDYLVYFEQSGTAAALAALTDEAVRTEADAIADVAMKITDNGGYVMGVIGIEGTEGTTAPAPGDLITVDLIYDLDGTVPDPAADIDFVIAQDNTDEFCLATVVDAGGGDDGKYRMVCPTVASLGGGANGNLDYVIESAGPVDELNYDIGAVIWTDDTTFNANKITVTTHADVGDDADDLISVFTTAADSGDANCGGTLLSSKVTGATPSPVIYFRMADAATLHVNLSIIARETDLYASCVNTETDQGAAGSAIAYSANKLLSGNLGTGLDYIYFDNDGDSTNWEVKATVLTTTTPDTYKAYWVGDNDTDVKATSAGAGTELIRTTNNFTNDSTFNVGKVTGGAKEALTTAVVYTGSDCTTQVSSETENPTLAGGYTQYFQGTTGTAYYVGVGDGTYTTCRKTDIVLAASQEIANINFNRTIGGTIPDESTVDAAAPGAANSISSVGVDLTTNGTTNEYLSAVVDPGAATTYILYTDATAGNDADNQVNFWGVNDGTGGPLLSRQDQSLASDATINTAIMYGEADANLELGANDYVKVCDDNLAAITSGMAGTCTTYLNTNDAGNGITVVDNAFGTADYSIHFVVGADTEGYLEIETNDATGGVSYAYRRVGAGNLADVDITAGDLFNAALSARMYGKMVEQYDYTTAIPNVLIDVLNDGDTITAVRGFSNAAGYYDLYDLSGETRDFSFTKSGYITKNYSTVTVLNDYDVPFDDTSAFNAVVLAADSAVEENAAGNTEDENSLGTGIKVTVKDGGGALITDATVAIHTCTDNSPANCSGTVYGVCTNPSGNCTRTGTNTVGNGLSGEYYFAGVPAATYIQIRVSDPSSPAVFETIYSPDPSLTVNSHLTSATTQLSGIVVPYNPAPECNLRVEGGSGTYTTGGNLYAKIGQTVNVFMDCGETGLTSVTLNGANIDASEGAAAMLDGGAGVDATASDGTYSYQLTVDAAGTAAYSITATATDNSGNTDNKDLWVNIDNTAPGTVTAVTDAGATDNDGVVTWGWTAATDANSGVKNYQVKISTNATCAADVLITDFVTHPDISYTRSGLTDGSTYYACVNAVDNLGTAGTAVNSDGITIDTTIPNQLVLNTPSNAGYSSDTTPDLTWFDVDGETGYEIQIDDDGTFAGDTGDFENNAAIAAGTVSYTVTGPMVTGSTYYWRVRALDSTGDNGIWSEAWHFTVDTTVPVVTLTAITDPQNTRSFLVEADADQEVTCRLSTDTAVYANMGITMTETNDGNDTHQATLTVPVDADYTVYATCQDAAGNTGTANQAAVTVFSTAPTVTVAAPNGGTYKTAQQIAITTDINAKCRYATSDISYTGMGAGNQFTGGEDTLAHTVTPVPAADGLIHYYVRCVGTVAANEMSSSVIVYYTYDTAVPTYAFSSMDNATAVKVGTVVTAYYEASEDLATSPTATICGEAAVVTRNGRLVKVVKTLTAAAAGNDIVLTGGTDVATNTATTLTDAGRLALDKVVPVLTVPLPTTNQTSKTFSVSVNGGEAGLSCRASIDADANTYAEMGLTLDYISASVYGATISVPVDGNYTIYFACQDTAGNETITDTGAAFTVDTIAPIEQSIVINTNALYSTSVALTLKIYSEGSDGYSLSCEPDVAWSGNTAYTAGTYTDVVFNLTTVNGTLGCTDADGFKTVYVRFKDAYNNYSTLSDTITLDVTAPTIGVLTAANTAGLRTVTLTWTAATDATSGIDYYDVYRDPATGVNKTDTKIASGLKTLGFLDNPEDGAWFYTVYATDKAGNESVLFVEKTVNVDTTPVGIVSTPVFGTYNVAGLAAAGGAKITPDAIGTCKWDTMDAPYASMGLVGDKEFAVLVATTYDLTALADADDYTIIQGLNEIYVRCKDANNNYNLNSTHISFIYDTVAPSYQIVSVTSNGNGRTVNGVLYANTGDTITVRFQASEALAGDPTVTIGGQAMAKASELGGLYTYTRTLNGTDETTTAIIAISGTTDVAVNNDADYSDAGVNAEFDFTAPTVVVTAPGTQNSKSFLINATAEANADCKMDETNVAFDSMDRFGLAETAVAGTFQGTYLLAADGTPTIYVRCRDYAGNEGTNNSGAFTVDTTEPSVLTITPTLASGWQIANPVAVTLTTDVNATCKYDDNESASYVLMDNTLTGGGGTTHTANIVNVDGINSYYVLCQDTNGVTNTRAITIAWKGDVNVPSTSVRVLPATGTAYQTGSILMWSVSTDAASGVATYTLEIDNNNTFASPEVTVAGLATNAYELTAGNKTSLNAGINYWRVKAIDNAAQNGAVQGTDFTFTLDKTAPTVEEMSPLDNATGVSIGVGPLLIFDERIEPSTLTPANIQLRKYSDNSVIALDPLGGILAENIVSEDGVLKTYVILLPAANLTNSIQYYITISAAVVDMSGNAFVAWDATTKALHEFTTVAVQTGALGVIGVTQVRFYGTADNTWANGWEWVVRATIPTDELNVSLKFANWTGIGSNSIATANNMRYYCEQAPLHNSEATALTVTTANSYADGPLVVSAALDDDTSTNGVQVNIHVQVKIPASTAGGSYSTNYGILSE